MRKCLNHRRKTEMIIQKIVCRKKKYYTHEVLLRDEVPKEY